MSNEVRLLGRPQIVVAGQVLEPPADRRSALLYYLARAASWVMREDLLYLFWPDSHEERARTNLRQLVHTLRESPFANGLQVDRTRLMWEGRSDVRTWSDVTSMAAADLTWPGEFMEGFRLGGAPEFTSWLDLEREAWRNLYRTRLLEFAHAEGDGNADRVSAWLDSWLVREPLDEQAVCASLELASRTGRSADAFARYARFEAALEEEYGVEPAPATRALIERIASGAHRSVDLPSNTHVGPTGRIDVRSPSVRTIRPSPLPRAASGRFVGRTDELVRLERELSTADCTVVTILGHGGMGKTRLALKAAELLAPRFPDGVVFTPLAQISDASRVPPAFATAMGIEPRRSASITDELEWALRGKRMLVILDNLEQIEGAADLINTWSALSPGTSWLLTSRTLVGVVNESIIELTGLGRPPQGAEPSDDHESVALLLDRATRAGRQLDMVGDAKAIADVVRLTGGIPLAIELAAGWLRALPLDAIAADLATGVDLTAPTDQPDEPRHASMHTVIESAWSALSTVEREAAIRLSVFEGGFDERAAHYVANVGRPLLLRLRNKSMLDLDGAGRFGWHPLLESFIKRESSAVAGADQDSACTESLNKTRERHARHYLDLLGRCEDLGHGGDPRRATATLRTESMNIEAAWLQAVESGWWDWVPTRISYFATALNVEGRHARWRQLLEMALKSAPQASVPWAVLALHEADVSLEEERYDVAYERLAAAVDILHDHGTAFQSGLGLLRFARAAYAADRIDEAVKLTTAAATEFHRANRLDMLGKAYGQLVWQSQNPSDHEHWFKVYSDWRQANPLAEGHSQVLAWHGVYWSLVYGEHRAGADLIAQAMQLETTLTWDPFTIAGTHWFLIEAVARTGDHAATLERLDSFEDYLSDKTMYRALIGEYFHLAATLRADLNHRLGKGGISQFVEANSEAAETLHGLQLRVRVSLERNDLSDARVLRDRLVARTPSGVGTVMFSNLQLQTTLLSARVSLADGDWSRARDDLLAALELAHSRHMLPSLLHSMVIATEGLEEDLAQEIRALAAKNPATPYFLRKAPERSTHARSKPTTDHEAAWSEASRLCLRVLDALRRPPAQLTPT